MTRPIPECLRRFRLPVVVLVASSVVAADPVATSNPGPTSVRSTALSVQPTDPIQRVVLDPMKVARILVGADRLTTLRFPSPIASLESALVTAEPHPDALFQVHFKAGEPFFSIRALATNTSTTLNVVWKEQTYVLELVESGTPWLSVIFESPAPVINQPRHAPLSPTQLMGRLDLAKAYGLLRQQQPSAVAGIEVARPNTVRDYGVFTARIEEIFRFDADDVLVFRVVLRNTTDTTLRFAPGSLMVRAGSRLYPQAITDADGILPSQTDVPVYFAVAGGSDGFRGELSPHNDFFLLLSRVPHTPQPTPQPTLSTTSSPPAAAPPTAPPPTSVTNTTPPPRPAVPAQLVPSPAYRLNPRRSWFQRLFQ